MLCELIYRLPFFLRSWTLYYRTANGLPCLQRYPILRHVSHTGESAGVVLSAFGLSLPLRYRFLKG